MKFRLNVIAGGIILFGLNPAIVKGKQQKRQNENNRNPQEEFQFCKS